MVILFIYDGEGRWDMDFGGMGRNGWQWEKGKVLD